MHAAVLHNHDAVGDQHRFVEVMSDEQDRLAGSRMDVQKFALKRFPGLRVERTEWLVHQQDLGVNGERACNADALFHAAG